MMSKQRGTIALLVLLTVLGLVALVAAACGGDGEEATPTTEPAATVEQPTAEPTVEAAETPTEAADDDHEHAEISFDAASATITVDGDSSDWDGIEGVTVPLEQIEIPEGIDWDEPGALDPIDVTLKVATDADNIYMLIEVPDDYDFDPADHNFSGSVAVMFLIDEAAGPHMGTSDEDYEASLGMVDIWHWELDCGPGELSGGGGIAGGDDPDCNLDDEYATDPETREDDGKADEGEPTNATAENSLVGVWEHTARAQGAGAEGTWIFEMSRPLQTGDTEDAQFASGGTALIAIAYFDADETLEGWTDTGHLQSSENGWIEVILP
ncbi:MAG: ethylbenzene dehydrogenase-related protein [Acidimicrobiia bacterium]